MTVLPWLTSEWPTEAREAWEERSGILEYDARMPRARAEAAAEEFTRREFRARPDLGASVVPKAEKPSKIK